MEEAKFALGPEHHSERIPMELEEKPATEKGETSSTKRERCINKYQGNVKRRGGRNPKFERESPCFEVISDKEVRRFQSFHLQHEGVEQLHSQEEFQNDWIPNSPEDNPTKSMDDRSGHFSSLLSHTNKQEVQEVSVLQRQARPANISVPKSSNGTQACPLDLYKAHEGSVEKVSGSRHQLYYIHRRFSGLEQVKEGITTTSKDNSEESKEVRITNKLKEIPSDSNKEVVMAGDCMGPDQVLHVTKRTTQEQNKDLGIKHLQEASGIYTPMAKVFRARKFCSSDSPSGPYYVVASNNRIQQINERISKQTSHSYTYFTKGQKVSANLDKEVIFEPVKQDKTCKGISKDYNRCKSRRLGRNLRDVEGFGQEKDGSRQMGLQREFSHKLPRDQSNRTIPEELCINELHSSDLIRQFSHSMLHQERGICQEPSTAEGDIQAAGLVSKEGPTPSSHPHQRKSECRSGPSVQICTNRSRMEAGALHIPTDMQAPGTSRSRSLCHRRKSTGEELYLPLSLQSGVRNKCISAGLEQMDPCLCIPSDQLSTQCSRIFTRNETSANKDIACSSFVAHSQMVSIDERVSTPPIPDNESSSHSTSSRENSASRFTRMLTATHMEFLRRVWEDAGCDDSSLLYAKLGWKLATRKCYERVWKKFQSYLITNNVKSFSLIHVANFLAFLGGTMKAKSLTSIQSTLLTTLRFAFPLECKKQDSCIKIMKQIVRGVARKSTKRVPLVNWDLEKVMDYLQKVRIPSTNSALEEKKEFLLKGFIILMIATGFRIGECLKIDAQSIKFTSKECIMTLDFCENFTRKFETSENLFIHFPIRGLQGERDRCLQLCPVNWVKEYFKLPAREATSKIFFFHPKNRRPLRGGTISKWFKALVQKIDPTACKPIPHDLRRIAASLPILSGSLTETQVLERGMWGNGNVLRRNYLCNLKFKRSIVALGNPTRRRV